MTSNHLCNRIEDGSRKPNQVDMQRTKIENRLITLCSSRKVKASIMAEIDRLCLLVVAHRMGLKDDDILIDPVGTAGECGIG